MCPCVATGKTIFSPKKQNLCGCTKNLASTFRSKFDDSPITYLFSKNIGKCMCVAMGKNYVTPVLYWPYQNIRHLHDRISMDNFLVQEN